MPIPEFEAPIEVSRTFGFKLGLLSYSSALFSATLKTQCAPSKYEATALDLHAKAQRLVEQDVELYRAGLSPMEPENGDASDAAFQSQARRNSIEESPFQVGEKPKDTGGLSATEIPQSTETTADDAAGLSPDSSAGIENGNKPETLISKKDETKRRGRPGSKKEEPYAPTPITNGKNFKADDTDVPFILGGTHTPEPEKALAELRQTVEAKPKTDMERIETIAQTLSKEHKRQLDSTKDLLRKFVKTFLGSLPRPDVDDSYAEILPLMESLAVTYGGDMLAKPEAMATAMKAGWEKLKRAIDEWPADCKPLALLVAVKYYPDNPVDLLEFLDVVDLTGQDVAPFMRVFLISKPAMVKLREMSASSKQSIAAIVGSWGNLDKSTETDLLNLIAKGAAPAKTQGDTLWQE